MVRTVVSGMIAEYAYQLWYPSNTAYAVLAQRSEGIRIAASVRAALMSVNINKQIKTPRMSISAYAI